MAIRRRSAAWRSSRRRAYSRVRTVRQVRSIARRQDQREIQRYEGKWMVFNEYRELTPQSGQPVNIYIPLPMPLSQRQDASNTGFLRGITIYGLNSLIAISSVTVASNDAPLKLALAATVLKEDEQLNDLPPVFPLITSTSTPLDPQLKANERPWRWFQPIVVMQAEGNPMKSAAMPYRFRRGNKVYLPPNPRRQAAEGLPSSGYGPLYTLVLGSAPQSGTVPKIGISWHGRYRFVEKALT